MSCVVCESYGVCLRPAVHVLVVPNSVRLAMGYVGRMRARICKFITLKIEVARFYLTLSTTNNPMRSQNPEA